MPDSKNKKFTYEITQAFESRATRYPQTLIAGPISNEVLDDYTKLVFIDDEPLVVITINKFFSRPDIRENLKKRIKSCRKANLPVLLREEMEDDLSCLDAELHKQKEE